MIRKEQYKSVNKKYYASMAQCLEGIVEIDNDAVKWLDKESDIFLWALFGENNDGLVECLQVGASIDGREEIVKDINKMFDKKYDQTTIMNGRMINTQFNKEVYKVPIARIKDEVDMEKHQENNEDIDKSKYQYRKIKQEYERLTFYKINVNQYLDIDDNEIKNSHVKDIFELSKYYYAETQFAFETQAIYWNAYRSGVGMERLKQLIPKK